MAHWIFIEEGTYPVDSACFFTPGNTAVVLKDAVMEVYLDGNLERRVRGSGMARNASIVELLEDHDDIDLLVDLGDQFKYCLKTPRVQGGKVFEPDVTSLVHFIATVPLQKLSLDDYTRIRERLTLIG